MWVKLPNENWIDFLAYKSAVVSAAKYIKYGCCKYCWIEYNANSTIILTYITKQFIVLSISLTFWPHCQCQYSRPKGWRFNSDKIGALLKGLEKYKMEGVGSLDIQWSCIEQFFSFLLPFYIISIISMSCKFFTHKWSH